MQFNICHLSEGISGHDGQVLGIIKTLGDAGHEVSTLTLNVYWRIHSLRGLLRFISRKLSKYPNFLTVKLILKCYKFTPLNKIDIIVSGGANLAPLNLALSKQHNTKNIHLSTPRDWNVSDFTAYITSSRVSDLPCNLVPVIAPNIFDPRTCKEMGEKFIAANAITEMNYSLLIMGGDGSGYVYQKNEWTALIENFIIFCKKNNTKPLFITSRRTPKKIEELIERNYDTSMSVLFHSEKTRGKFHHLLYIAQNIFVTEDSSTMLSEAISSGKRIISIFPREIDAPDKYTEINSKYENLEFIVRCEINKIIEFSFTGELDISERVNHSLRSFQNSLIETLGINQIK